MPSSSFDVIGIAMNADAMAQINEGTRPQRNGLARAARHRAYYAGDTVERFAEHDDPGHHRPCAAARFIDATPA